MEKQKHSWIMRLAVACKAISDKARAQRERIERFQRNCDDLITRIPVTTTQEKIDSTQTADQLLDYLNAEREALAEFVDVQSRAVGGMPRQQRWLALDRLMKFRHEGLDLRGARWGYPLRFHFVGKAGSFTPQYHGRNPDHPRMYVENKTGRVIDEGEYQAIGGPTRSALYTRIK